MPRLLTDLKSLQNDLLISKKWAVNHGNRKLIKQSNKLYTRRGQFYE
jgi:hypothetical protein